MNVVIAFVTGLTTGGLSCLAVQGGLLASSLAAQLEQDVQQQRQPRTRRAAAAGASKPGMAAPILLFLAAKLAAYTLLGFLLGLAGSVVQLDSTGRAVLQFAIGIFMIGNALRMLNVHPVFRYFAFEPPKMLTRYLRRKAKRDTGWMTPLVLGALTVLIPCGVTQSMMALAVATGDPFSGAAVLFAFTLGASPVFFAVAYFATRLGSRLERSFNRLVAVTVLVLGFVAIETGLNLMGSPYSISALTRSLTSAPAVTAEAAPDGVQVLSIDVKNYGYMPEVLVAAAGSPVRLELNTWNTRSCSRAFTIPALKVEKLLPATGTVVIEIPPQPAGSVLQFSCSMGMYGGVIRFN